MKRAAWGFAIGLLVGLGLVVIESAASYPSSVKSFTTKATTDTIQAAHVNDLQDEVTAVENGLLNGLAHTIKPLTDAAYDLGTSLLRWRNLYLSGELTLANTSLHLLDTNASHDLIIAPGSNITADRTWTIVTGDASRSLTQSADITLTQDLFTLPSLTDPNADRLAFWDDSAGAVAWLTAGTGLTISGTSITAPGGYVLQGGGAALSGDELNPTDATTYYLGGVGAHIRATTADTSRVYFPKAGTVTYARITFMVTGTTATTETSTASIRLNNTSDTTISASTAQNAEYQSFANTGLSLAVTTSDYFQIKWVSPTWSTDPTQIRIYWEMYVTGS